MKRLALIPALAALACTAALAAEDPFHALANRLPRSANVLGIVNLEKMYQSPQAIREGWKKKIEGAFEAGVTRVPPQTARLVVGMQLDLDNVQPLWEAAVIDLNTNFEVGTIAMRRSGKADKINGLPVAVLPGDVFLVQFGPRTLGALAPANRQAAARWLREIEPSSKVALSPYLEKAAGYADTAGTDIVMAIDLGGAFSLERTTQYVKKAEALRSYSQDWSRVAQLLAGVEGMRLGIRVDEKSLARVTLDFSEDASVLGGVAKPLLMGMLKDAGMELDDLATWKSEVKGNQLSLQGYLSTESLRLVLSLFHSPAPADSVVETPEKVVEKPSMAELSLAYFQKIMQRLKDLKALKRDSKTFGQQGAFYDRYAGLIEQMPTLGVDPEVVDYGYYAAQQLRAAAATVRGANINIGINTSQSANDPSNYGGYGYGGYGYGGYGYGYGGYGAPTARNVMRSQLNYEMSQGRVIRKTGEGEARLSIEGIRDELITATNETRRRMTDKYQIQF